MYWTQQQCCTHTHTISFVNKQIILEENNFIHFFTFLSFKFSSCIIFSLKDFGIYFTIFRFLFPFCCCCFHFTEICCCSPMKYARTHAQIWRVPPETTTIMKNAFMKTNHDFFYSVKVCACACCVYVGRSSFSRMYVCVCMFD